MQELHAINQMEVNIFEREREIEEGRERERERGNGEEWNVA